MTEFKFPEAQPIDWDVLDDGDRVLIEAVVRTYCSKHNYREKRLQRSTDVGAYLFATEGSLISGHVIKAPKPLAVGDKVMAVGWADVYEIVAFDNELAWLKRVYRSANPSRLNPSRLTVHISHLARVEP
jgi:hypothetical protein